MHVRAQIYCYLKSSQNPSNRPSKMCVVWTGQVSVSAQDVRSSHPSTTTDPCPVMYVPPSSGTSSPRGRRDGGGDSLPRPLPSTFGASHLDCDQCSLSSSVQASLSASFLRSSGTRTTREACMRESCALPDPPAIRQQAA